jgi:hypothetical protein
MVNLVPVSRSTHANQVWRRLRTFGFAAKDHYVPIAGTEFGRVVSAMPIGFVDLAGQLAPVAILSLEPGTNAFVGSDGRWLAPYVPFLFLTYPFRLLRQPGTDQFSLWVDSDADQLPDAAHSTELFYDAEGNLAPATKAVLDLLAKFEQNRLLTIAAVATLAQEGVLCPWEFKLSDGGKERVLRGLQRVDEVALNRLQDDAFLRLRKSQALSMAYAQLLSMGQLNVLSQLQRLRGQMGAPGAPMAPSAPDARPGEGFTMLDPDSLRFD